METCGKHQRTKVRTSIKALLLRFIIISEARNVNVCGMDPVPGAQLPFKQFTLSVKTIMNCYGVEPGTVSTSASEIVPGLLESTSHNDRPGAVKAMVSTISYSRIILSFCVKYDPFALKISVLARHPVLNPCAPLKHIFWIVSGPHPM